MAAVVSRQV